MEEDKRTAPGLSKGEEQGGEVSAGEKAGDEDLPRGDASPGKEDASVANGGGHGDAEAEGDEEGDEEDMADESEGIAAEGNAGCGAASGSAKNEDFEVPKNPFAARFRYRAAIANPTPPTTYRRLPLRSRKQYRPTRFFAAGAVPATPRSAGSSAVSATGQGTRNEAQGSTVTCSESSSASDDCESGRSASSSASASFRLPSRSRKQRRPGHFVPEEAEASARARAHRSNAVLDRFLTAMVRVPPERRPEWVRNVTADDGGGQEQPDEEGPGEPDGRARILTILAVLGGALALSIVSCVLFYIVGQRTEDGR